MPYPWSAGNVLTATDLNSSLAAKTDLAMVQNAQTGTSYSYALADASKLLSMSNAASNTVLVTKQATVTWVTGTQLRVINLGAGVTTLVADTGVTINNNKALGQFQGGTLIRTASDVWTFQPNGGQKVLQVVSTFKADTFTTTSTTLVDVTGLSVSITPSSASNLVLVTVSLSLGNNTNLGISRGAILRDSTAIGGGTAAGSRPSGSLATAYAANSAAGPQTMMFLDSPATTAATTYKIQIASESATTATVGQARASDDLDNARNPRLSSSITVMEVTP